MDKKEGWVFGPTPIFLVVFKSDEKPEAISRLVDRLIQTVDDHTHVVKE